MTSELQGSGGDEGRSSTKGLQVTPEGLLMTSELQGSGGDEGRSTTGLHVTSECLLMDLEQAKDETLREPERAQGKPDTDGRRQPSEHVASAVSMAGQVAQQLCPDAGRVALFVARFAEDLGRLAASDKGWNAVELGGESSFEGVWGPWWPVWWCPFYGCELPNTGAGWEHTAADQGVPGGWGRVRIRWLALCRQRRPRGRSQQAPGGHPLVTAVRAGRALGKQRHLRGRMWAVLPARAHRAHCQAARRLSARHVAASALVPGASDSSSRLKNNAFAALASDSEDEEEVEREPVPAVELPVKNGKQDEGGNPQLRSSSRSRRRPWWLPRPRFRLLRRPWLAPRSRGARQRSFTRILRRPSPSSAGWNVQPPSFGHSTSARPRRELISSTRLLRSLLPGALHFQSLPHVRRAQGWHREQRVRRLLR